MFKLFKRRKGEIAAAHKGWLLMGQWIDRRQRMYANWLQGKTKQFSARTVALWLMLFCLVIALCSTYIIYSALSYLIN